MHLIYQSFREDIQIEGKKYVTVPLNEICRDKEREDDQEFQLEYSSLIESYDAEQSDKNSFEFPHVDRLAFDLKSEESLKGYDCLEESKYLTERNNAKDKLFIPFKDLKSQNDFFSDSQSELMLDTTQKLKPAYQTARVHEPQVDKEFFKSKSKGQKYHHKYDFITSTGFTSPRNTQVCIILLSNLINKLLKIFILIFKLVSSQFFTQITSNHKFKLTKIIKNFRIPPQISL
jgi:hypothetical protein